MCKNDILYDSTCFYMKNLNNHLFHLQAGNKKRELIDFNISFNESNFKHLMGFQYLTDLYTYNLESIQIIQLILNKELNITDLEKSAYFDSIKNRIIDFKEISNCIFSRKIMLGKIGTDSFKSIKADFLLTKDIKHGVAEFFIKEETPGITVPVTFFTAPTNEYIRRTKPWTVLDVKDITNDSSTNKITIAQLLQNNYKIRYQDANPDILINKSFDYNNETYTILDVKPIKKNMQTKSEATIQQQSDGSIFIDNDFAANNPFKLNKALKATEKHIIKEK